MINKKLALFILVVLWAFGCTQKKKSESQNHFQTESNLQDSVLFEIGEPDFQASFRKISDSGQGSAQGPTLFQRYGNLHYILDELYADQTVKVLNNPNARQDFKIEIQWDESANMQTIWDSVLSHLQNYFNYNVRRDSIVQKQYVLSVVNHKKLNEAISDKTKEKFTFKSEISNGQWTVIAFLPRFAESLGERLDSRIQLKESYQSNNLYSFEIDLRQSIADLKKELESQYGLSINTKRVSAERIVIDFNK